MPAKAALTERGREGLAMLPPWAREDPDFRAIVHVYAREGERAEEKIEQVRANLFPQTADILLGAWEALLRMTINGPGTIDQRRLLVMAYMQRFGRPLTGAAWEAAVTALIGPTWTYQEHDPEDPSSPPPYTIRVALPFPPDSDMYLRTEHLLRAITPANQDLIVTFTGGFVLDLSQLDEEEMQ